MNKYVFIPYDKYKRLVESKKTNADSLENIKSSFGNSDTSLIDTPIKSVKDTDFTDTVDTDPNVQIFSDTRSTEATQPLKLPNIQSSLVPPPPGSPDTEILSLSGMVFTFCT